VGKFDKHLPKRPYDKQPNPKDTPNIDPSTRKRHARGTALRRKDDAKKAKRGDDLNRGER
jgi:hypothetical protein